MPPTDVNRKMKLMGGPARVARLSGQGYEPRICCCEFLRIKYCKISKISKDDNLKKITDLIFFSLSPDLLLIVLYQPLKVSSLWH